MARQLTPAQKTGRSAVTLGRKVLWGRRAIARRVLKMLLKKSGFSRKLKKIGGRMFTPPSPKLQTIYIPSPNLGQFEKYLGKHFKSSLAHSMRVAGKQAVKLLRDNTYVKDRGGMMRGWKSEVKGLPALFVFNKQPYAHIIELGRKPGSKFPPVEAIRGWVKRQINPPPTQLKSVAFLVGRKIATDGIAARPIMTDPSMRKMLSDMIFSEIIRVLNETCYKQALIAAVKAAHR